MTLVPLTPEEQARHQRGIEKIRRQLFRRYTPADYFIVPGSESVLNASAEACWNAACGSYRVFRFGGLRYRVDCANEHGPMLTSITHVEANQFLLWIGTARSVTVNCVPVRFHDLDEEMHSRIVSCRRVNMRSRLNDEVASLDQLLATFFRARNSLSHPFLPICR